MAFNFFKNKVEGDDEAACAEAIQKFLSENV